MAVKKSCHSRIRILKILGRRLKRSSRVSLLRVGSALIFSKLFFGLGLTSINTQNVERILGPIYNDVVRQASGAFVTSPIDSIMAESGCLPFRLAIIQRLAQLAARIEEKNSAATDYPVVKRARESLRQTSNFNLPQICTVLRTTDREWHKTPPKIDNYLRQSIKAGTAKEIAAPVFQEFITTRYHSHQQIYTDGSKDNEFIGAGLVLPTGNSSHRLPSMCTVYSAEAFALNIAVSKINAEENAIILTDSASCLDALRSGQSKHPWIQSIESTVENKNITFSWIPGHAGITGNELADTLAKQGRHEPLTDIPVPSQDAVHFIKKEIWKTWAMQWHQSRDHLGQIKRMPTKQEDQKCASEQRILTRLRIGHTRLTHSYILKREPPPVCIYCGVQRTVQHILVDCRGYAQARTTCGLYGTLANILEHNKDKEKAVLQFIKDSNLLSEI